MSNRDPRNGPAPGASAEAAGEPGPQDGADSAATISELRQQVAEAQDQRLRALADVENVRKRCAAQVSRIEAEVTARVAAQWLPVVDNLERALGHPGAAPGAIIEGIRGVRDQPRGVRAALGSPRRDDTGAPFAPARHDAIATRTDSAAPPG